MKLFANFVLTAIAISHVSARSGTQNVRADALSPVNQGTNNRAQALGALHKRHAYQRKKHDDEISEIDDLAYWLKHDGYVEWCRTDYLDLPSDGGEVTTTETETATESILTTISATYNVTATVTYGNATVTGPPATATLTQTVIGNSSTVILTKTIVETSTVYNATTTSWAIPSDAEVTGGAIGAAHHFPVYIQFYKPHVVRAACLKIVDGPATKTETETATVSETSTSTKFITATVTATAANYTITFTPTITATLTETAPGATITSNATITTTTTETLPTQTLVADPCDETVAKWHKADEGSGPCCADWTPIQLPSAKDCCYKCWKTEGCPAWFYGLNVPDSWQTGYCWTPGYVDPPIEGSPASCPAGKIAIDQYLTGIEDLQVAAGPCNNPSGGGNWEL